MTQQEYLDKRKEIKTAISDLEKADRAIQSKFLECLLEADPHKGAGKVTLIYKSNQLGIEMSVTCFIGERSLDKSTGKLKYTFYKIKKDGTQSALRVFSDWQTPIILSIYKD